MPAVDQDRTSILCHHCDQLGHFKRKCPLRIKHHQQKRQQSVRHHQQQQHGQHQQKPRGRRQNNGGEQECRFRRNITKSASRGQAALAATRSRAPLYDFSDDTLDGNYVSHDILLRDVQNYTSALDFVVDTSAGTVELFLPQQASPGVTSPGGASPAGISPWGSYNGGTITFTSTRASPGTGARACTRTSTYTCYVAPRATNGHANHGTVGVMPAVTRSRAESLLPVPVATRYGRSRNNSRAHEK